MHARFDDMSDAALLQRPIVRQATLKQGIESEPRVCLGDRPNGKQNEHVGTSDEWASALTACLEAIDGS